MSFSSNSAQMLFWRCITIGIGTTTAILLARLLGPEDRGALAMLVLSVSLTTLILQFGFPEALIYVVGSNVFPDEQITSTIAAYFILIIAVFSTPVGFYLNYHMQFSLLKTSLLILAASVSICLTTLRHLFLARKQFKLYSLSVVSEGMSYLTGILVAWVYFRLSVENALIAYVGSLSVALVIILALQFRTIAAISLQHIRLQIIIKCFQHGFHLFITGIGGFGAQRINYFLLESLLGIRAVGLFAAASTVPTLFANFPQQLGTVMYSHVANTQTNDQGMQLTVKVFKLVFILSMLCLLPLAIFSKGIVLILFGKDFADVNVTLVILSVGMALTGLSGILFNALAGIGLHKFGSVMTFINIALISLIGYLLIPVAGVEGAAWAQSLAALANFMFILWVYRRQFDLQLKSLLFVSKSEWSLLVNRFVKVASCK